MRWSEVMHLKPEQKRRYYAWLLKTNLSKQRGTTEGADTLVKKKKKTSSVPLGEFDQNSENGSLNSSLLSVAE